MKIETATQDDFESWLDLARQVERLFGPMAGEETFRQALRQAMDGGQAFCIREGTGGSGSRLCAGIVVSPEENGIEWFAVAEDHRDRGLGRALLQFAIDRLDSRRDMSVQTFAPGVPEGAAARRLYLGFGFRDHILTDPTPAGIPTVLMVRPGAPH